MLKKSFNEKMKDSKDMPKIIKLTDPRSIAVYGGENMLIAPPLFYDEVMRKIPEGRLTTSDRIRKYLAAQNNAEFTCPLTAGIFMNLVAQASFERETDKTPYWRTLKKDGELNCKFPCGIEMQKTMLEAEGHTVINKGKRFFVKDYEKKLFEL